MSLREGIELAKELGVSDDTENVDETEDRRSLKEESGLFKPFLLDISSCKNIIIASLAFLTY